MASFTCETCELSISRRTSDGFGSKFAHDKSSPNGKCVALYTQGNVDTLVEEGAVLHNFRKHGRRNHCTPNVVQLYRT